MVLIVTLGIYVAAIAWPDDVTRLTTYTDFDGVSAVLETDDDTLWIFWTRKSVGSYNLFYVTTTDRGASWSQETQLTANSSANAGVSACQASDGTIWVVWGSDRTGNYELFYKTSSDLGASWSNDTQLTFDSRPDLKPVIRQLSDGSFWVVWASDRSGDYDVYLKVSSDNGGSWSDDVQLTNDSYLDRMPTVAQTSNGTIWVVWASDRTGNYDLYYKTSSDLGASWSDDTQLTSGPKVESNPCVLQTLNGKIWLFWSKREPADVETSTDDIYYMYSSDQGTSWTDAFRFTTDAYDDIWPSVVQAKSLKLWVVWTSDRADQPDWGNYDIYYKTSLVGDINEDGVIDVFDLTIVSFAFGYFEGEPGYNPEADLNVDGVVDMRDLSLVAHYVG
jgi:hypothetical protein